eukprot:73480-Chlamydomonas_euryale.AAC.1
MPWTAWCGSRLQVSEPSATAAVPLCRGAAPRPAAQQRLEAGRGRRTEGGGQREDAGGGWEGLASRLAVWHGSRSGRQAWRVGSHQRCDGARARQEAALRTRVVARRTKTRTRRCRLVSRRGISQQNDVHS